MIWREPEQLARDQKIFAEELDDFLPAKILDFHVHVCNEGFCDPAEPFNCAGQPLTKYDYADLRHDMQLLLPGREFFAVCFGNPDPRFDFQANNECLRRESDHQQFFPLKVFDPNTESPETLRQDLASGDFLGLKPYHRFVRKEDSDAIEIHEMLPAWAMEIADQTGALVMLHIPRSQRLADPVNQRQLVELAERYPGAKIIVAHLGRAYFMANITGYLAALKDIPNMYFDIAMVSNWEVLEYAFEQIPHEKLLYGSDIPIANAPGNSVEINNQYSYVTPAPWDISICDDTHRIEFTSFLNEEMRAVKKAVERLGLGADFVEQLFFRNGMALLGQG